MQLKSLEDGLIKKGDNHIRIPTEEDKKVDLSINDSRKQKKNDKIIIFKSIKKKKKK